MWCCSSIETVMINKEYINKAVKCKERKLPPSSFYWLNRASYSNDAVCLWECKYFEKRHLGARETKKKRLIETFRNLEKAFFRNIFPIFSYDLRHFENYSNVKKAFKITSVEKFRVNEGHQISVSLATELIRTPSISPPIQLLFEVQIVK